MSSFRVKSILRRLGEDVRVARKKRRLSVADFCERIGVTDKTLARLERGDGGVRLEVFVSALLALGELHRLESLLEPSQDEVGISIEKERLPERISRPRRHRRPADPVEPHLASRRTGTPGENEPDDEGSAF